jgi:hypothetical protein
MYLQLLLHSPRKIVPLETRILLPAWNEKTNTNEKDPLYLRISDH